jgi:flagellar biosynthesis protein FlhG
MQAGNSLARLPVAPVQVIAVTGGKGGVGKTTVSVNLATGLARAGRRTILLDGDLGLANVDVLLGLTPRHTLAHFLAGERTLEEILLPAPQGFQIVPGASGIEQLASLSEAEHAGIIRAFGALASRTDVLVVDTAAGIAPGVLRLVGASQQVLLVVCDEPASITDAYALMKVLSRNHGVGRFRVLANMTREAGAGRRLFETLLRVTGRFLDVTLEFAGEIPEDPWLRRSIREQRPVLDAFPASRSAQAFTKLAQSALGWQLPAGARGTIEFFAERLLERPRPRLGVVR